MGAKTVAVVGASPDRRKYGNKAVRAHVAAGFTVYPVHPSAAEVEGVRCYATLRDVPAGRLDRVTFYVPPAVGLPLLDHLAGRDIGELLLNPGTDSPELLARAAELGLPAVTGCSIIAAGYSPGRFGDE